MELKLIQLGEYGNIEHPISSKECVIGREPSCHVRPDHGKVSNRHCRLYWQGLRLMVEDLNSASGTSVNGVEVEGGPAELRDFDLLRAGPVTYLVLLTQTPEEMASRTREWVAEELRRRSGGAKGPSDSNVVSPAMETARAILGKLVEEDTHARSQTSSSTKGKHGLDVSSERGVAVAQVLDRSLIDENEIGLLARSLEQLIETGHNRIALNLGNVEHCSSQALSTLLKAHERCRASGGLLKVCSPRPQVAELFKMTNLQKHIEIFPDALPALESVWPQPAAPEPTDSGGPPPAVSPARPATPLAEPSGTSSSPVELVVDVGKAKGQTIPIKSSRFIIGRDRRCQLRPSSDTVSRVHVIIEIRGGKVYVRDYGTKNGTRLNDRILRGEEAEVHNNDRLGVGILQFHFRIRPGAVLPEAELEDALASLLLDQEPSDADAPTALIPTYKPDHDASASASPTSKASPPASAEPEAPTSPVEPPRLGHIDLETRNGILVVTVRPHDLDDESTVGPFRYELQTLFEQALPRRVVLDLENVDYLSSRAVGVILAFFQHLEREGGTLRVCCVQPKLLNVLDQMRLPRLIDLYASVDEAVSDPWV